MEFLKFSVFDAETVKYGSSGIQALSKVEFRRRKNAVYAIFYNRAYWTRRWIVQELVSAAEIKLLCGSREFNVKSLRVIMVLEKAFRLKQHPMSRRINDKLGKLGQLAFSDLITCLTILSQQENENLSELLSKHSRTRFSEPRDAIYALLSMSSDIGIEVDYSRSTADIYTEATRKMITNDRSFNIIGMSVGTVLGEAQAPPYLKLPSWVPHFESIADHQALPSWTSDAARKFRGAELLPFEDALQYSPNNDVLRIQGCFSGTIAKSSHRIKYEDFEDVDALLEDCTSPASGMQELETPPLGSRQHFKIWKSFCRDNYEATMLGTLERISSNANVKENFELDYAIAVDSSIPVRLTERLRLSLMDSTVCITSAKAIALVYGDVQCGAYFEGLMDGEAFSGSRAPDLFKEDWTQCEKPVEKTVYLI